jgi:hypothetical protein
MARFNSIILAVVISATSFRAFGMPIVESWTMSKQSYDSHNIAPDRFVLEGVDKVLLKPVAKFTVRAGDVYRGSTGERSEVVLGGWKTSSPFRISGDEGLEFYRISVKLSPDWVAPTVNSKGHVWGMFFQAHGPNEFAAPPAIALRVEDEFSLFLLGGDLNAKVGGRRFMTKADLNVGKWVDFILEIKWAPDSNGAIAVYRRDQGEHEWAKVSDIKSVATLQHKGSPIPNSHYWQAGFYRSESKHVNTLWLGPILRGRTFSEVAE